MKESRGKGGPSGCPGAAIRRLADGARALSGTTAAERTRHGNGKGAGGGEQGAKMKKRCYFDETNLAIYCKQRAWLFETLKTNWFLSANEPKSNPKTGQKPTLCAASNQLIVTHVSTHCSLAEAIRRVRQPRVRTILKLTSDAVGRLIENPRIAVAGLNPHAGEHGLFGREETVCLLC